jgi:guanylate kinase
MDEYKNRLKAWFSESDEEIEMRLAVAATQIEAAKKTIGKKPVEGGGIVFDHILVNEEVRGLSRLCAFGSNSGLLQQHYPIALAHYYFF